MRRTKPISLLAIAVVTAFALLFAACSSADEDVVPQAPAAATAAPAAPGAPSTGGGTAPAAAATAIPAPAATARPAGTSESGIERGGILSHAVHETFASFDIHWEGSYIATQPLSPIYNGLLIRDITAAGDDPAGQIAPDLAESWEAFDGGLKYVFNLRDDVTFNDGSEFSCEDVDATFTRWFNPDVSTRGSNFPTMRQDWKCLDDTTFEVNFDVPQGSFLTAIASARFEMMQKETIAQVERFRTGITKEPRFLVGTGPYMVDTWTPGVDFVAQRRLDYWKIGEDGGTLPYLDGYKSIVMPDLSAIFAAFRARQLTMGGIARHLEKSEATIIEGRPDLNDNVTILVGPRNAFHNIRFNMESPIVSDVRIRQAFWLTIDQRGTIQAAVEGWGGLGTFIGPHLPFGIPEDEMLAHEYFGTDMEARQAKARDLIAQAGFPDGLDLELIQRRGPLYNRGAIANQADLKKGNINVSLRLVDTATIGDVARSGNYDIYTSPGSTLLDDPDGYWNWLLSTQSTNVNLVRYNSPEFDRLYAEQAREINIVERIKITREIDRLLLKDLPVHRSYYWQQTMSYWNNLQGWEMNFGDNVYNFGKWERVWCKTGKCQ